METQAWRLLRPDNGKTERGPSRHRYTPEVDLRRRRAVCEIGVCKEVQAQLGHWIANPSDQAELAG